MNPDCVDISSLADEDRTVLAQLYIVSSEQQHKWKVISKSFKEKTGKAVLPNDVKNWINNKCRRTLKETLSASHPSDASVRRFNTQLQSQLSITEVGALEDKLGVRLVVPQREIYVPSIRC